MGGSLAQQELPAAISTTAYNANNQLTTWGTASLDPDDIEVRPIDAVKMTTMTMTRMQDAFLSLYSISGCTLNR
jgi:hypothetical protein